MAFWNGKQLATKLPALIKPNFDPNQIDCASYRLKLGGQAFVTKDRTCAETSDAPIVQHLKDDDAIVVIKPGQFAFLLTEETVKVPDDAIALISMRAGMKFRGLINVSGFHVDPGYEGKLIFGVYNAGPADIYLAKGDAIFLIVYADLDSSSPEKYVYKKSGGHQGIPAEFVQKMTGQVFSPILLQRRMEDLDKSHRELEKELASMKGRDFFHVSLTGIALTFIGVAIAMFIAVTTSDWAKAAVGMWLKDSISAYEANVKKDIDVSDTRSNPPNQKVGVTAAVAPTPAAAQQMPAEAASQTASAAAIRSPKFASQ